MMGRRQVEQAALFYEFSLERHVPPDHLPCRVPGSTVFPTVNARMSCFGDSTVRNESATVERWLLAHGDPSECPIRSTTD